MNEANQGFECMSSVAIDLSNLQRLDNWTVTEISLGQPQT